jgi:hypothetical protein
VLNGAIDMAGEDGRNMRCFEAIACGALLLSDAGKYPKGRTAGIKMQIHDSAQEAVQLSSVCLDNAASEEKRDIGNFQQALSIAPIC